VHELLPLSDTDRAFLNRAIELGERGWGRVHPNPRVGCVVVREGRIVGEGWHEVFGGPHAETMALAAAGPAARGATVYVSLEPCRHEGKTPACTRALLASGVSRVVFGAADPGSASGGGGRELAMAGVAVVGPALDADQARRLNPAFHLQRPDRPWVALKLATSLDGAVAEAPGRRTRLTGSEAGAEVHRLRAGFDGIMIGGVTARVDDPLLTARGEVEPRVPPVRVVLDPDASLPSDAALFRDVAEVPLWVFTREDASEAELERLESAGAWVHPVPTETGSAGRLDLTRVLRVCREGGLTALLCEGGGRLGAALMRAGLVDRLYLFVAPRVLGPSAVPAFPAWPPFAAAGEGWDLVEPTRVFGDDALFTFDRSQEV
jgi:diaminohydroxyphosphoribosylaminopyrimidine deaminase/5-amino-6-(5-phosphoribosylamino)uracil reductase